MKELASKYVDRAAMRRDGGESTQAQEEEATPAAGYRAMAPTTQGTRIDFKLSTKIHNCFFFKLKVFKY